MDEGREAVTSVLDHGDVILVDSMANDYKVVQAARISTGNERIPGVGGGLWLVEAEQEAKDRKLINYLMVNGHGTPFEHAVFQFYVKCPIFVAREWQRHRIASYNEFSMRYAEVAEETAEFYIPDHVRVVDPVNKQSSIRVDERPEGATAELGILGIQRSVEMSFRTYRDLIAMGMAREMARMVLPVNIYTRFWFTVNARSLMNFLMLRTHPNAQWEIQQYALALEAFFAEKMPWTHDAFVANGRKAP